MEKEALAFIQQLQKDYFEQRDLEKVISAIDPHTSWIGSGKHEICKSFTDAEYALFAEKADCDCRFTITNSWYETAPISSDSCIVYGEVRAVPSDSTSTMANLYNRLSAVCTKTPDGMRLLHLHLSRPDDDLCAGEYFAKKSTRTDNQALRNIVDRTNRQLEILTGNVPGGVHQCRHNSQLSLLSMSGGFLSMFGYTREEIHELFNDSFLSMIYEADRQHIIDLTTQQLLHGDTVEYEYRVQCKDGSLMWILDRGRLVTLDDGSQSFFCIMIDITQRKAEREQLRLSLERHKIIMDQTTNIIFEWNILTDTIDFSSNWVKKFGYEAISSFISQEIPLSQNIHPEDMPAFIKIMYDTSHGIPYAEAEFRIRGRTDDFIWCKIQATAQFDSNNLPVKVVGVILDIDEEKLRNRLLLDAAQQDALTKLYNKNATKSKVESLLSSSCDSQTSALMIIDIDNFKTINDIFGHHCGDAVLINMSTALKRLFRSSDVIGRIGGDEFLVFMHDVKSAETVAARAKDVVQIFDNTPPEVGMHISCSVGIALYPHDALDYATLSRCADSALYSVKNTGKVNYAFANQVSRDCTPFSEMRTAINECLDDNDSVGDALIPRAFSMLYNAPDISKVVNDILHLFGTAYNVSRAYIFETSDDGLTCSNTFEWCNDGISPEIDSLQNLSFKDDLPGFFENYDESGVFYCQDVSSLNRQLYSVLERQGVASVLQCFIKDGGEFRGYIGFDECTKNRYWTKAQVNTLSLISQIISTFLIKYRVQQRLAELSGKD